MVDFPLLFNPTTRMLICSFLIFSMLANLSNRPMVVVYSLNGYKNGNGVKATTVR